VYKGLLLGTGPQVDPGFEGNLFIPLHNFTTTKIKIHLNQYFVSIDFLHTTLFVDPNKVSSLCVSDLRKELVATRKMIDEPKVKRRRTLEDYLEGSTPRSQMAQFQAEVEKLVAKMESELVRVKSELDTARKWNAWERLFAIVALLGIVVATLNFYRGYVADIKSETKEMKGLAGAANIRGLQNRVSSLEASSAEIMNRSRDQMASLVSSSSAIATNMVQMEGRLKNLELQIVLYQKGLTNADPANTGPGPNK
jgi:hypothetical protein